MKTFHQTVDYNGMVMFDPLRLHEYFGSIKEGDNLFKLFTTTDHGDEVVKRGIAVPILSIDDSYYEILLRRHDEASSIPDEWVIGENGVFPLTISSRLVFADMAVLVEWEDDLGWTTLDEIAPGDYAVTIRGFRQLVGGVIERFGFEIVFEAVLQPVAFTGDLERRMQVLVLDEM